MNFTAAEITRFNKKYIPVSCGCWLWNGPSISTGYGRFRISWNPIKAVGAHRASWRIFKGEIPHGMHVLHHCDIPACVNPAHLFLGTPADNTADRKSKGRTLNAPTGKNHRRAILTEEIAAEIRSIYSGEHGQISNLARRFNVARSAIYCVLRGETWKL